MSESLNKKSGERSNSNQPENEMSAGDFIEWALRGLLKAVYGVVACVMVIVAIYETRNGIFEHGQGWNDLDSLEITFFVLLTIFTERFFRKAKESGFSWWQRSSRFVHYVAIYVLVTYVPVLLVVLNEELALLIKPHLDELSWFMLFGYVVVIYAMTPIPAIDSKNDAEIEKENTGSFDQYEEQNTSNEDAA